MIHNYILGKTKKPMPNSNNEFDDCIERTSSSIDNRASLLYHKRNLSIPENKDMAPFTPQIKAENEMQAIQSPVRRKQIPLLSQSETTSPTSKQIFHNGYVENNYTTNTSSVSQSAFSFPLSNLYKQTFQKRRKLPQLKEPSSPIRPTQANPHSHKKCSKMVIEDYEYNKLNRIARYLKKVAQRRASISSSITNGNKDRPVLNSESKANQLYSLVISINRF